MLALEWCPSHKDPALPPRHDGAAAAAVRCHFDESESAVESGDDCQRSTLRAWRDHCEARLRAVHERGLPHNLDELLRQADGKRHIRTGLAPA